MKTSDPLPQLTQLTRLRLQRDPRVLERFRACYEWLATMPRATRRWLSRSFRRKLAMTLAAAALLIALSGMPVYAASITVDPGAAGINPSDGCSLVEAIINANDNAATYAECVGGTGDDTITLPASATLTYTVAYGTNAALPDVTNTLTIEGSSSTIQRDGAAPQFRILNVYNGTFILNEATITGGDVAGVAGLNGGGMYVYNATALLTDTTVTQNYADIGGGIYCYRCELAVYAGTVISNNYAEDAGGGIANYGGTEVRTNQAIITGNDAGFGGGIAFAPDGILIVNNTTISGNTAYAGGGLLAYNSATIVNSTITENTATYGGGIVSLEVISSEVVLTVSNSTISGNHATSSDIDTAPSGGGIYNIFSEAHILKSTISGNDADVRGGGIFNGPLSGYLKTAARENATPQARERAERAAKSASHTKWYEKNKGKFGGKIGGKHAAERATDKHKPEAIGIGDMFLVNSTISGNSATFGGGIANEFYIGLDNVTVTNNTATGYGGGISTAGYANFSRSLISGNTAPSGSEIDACYCFVYTADDYNLFGHNGETNAQAFYYFTPGPADFNATSDGDGTSTHIPTALASILNATLGNNGGQTQTHALIAGSPAIDKAPNTECAPLPVNGVDQRSFSRNVDGNGAPTANDCDIGAYEFNAPTAVNVTGFKSHIGKAGNVAVKWRTTNESQIAGFNVYRKTTAKGKEGSAAFKQVNAEFLQAKQPGNVAGNAYRFKDKGVRPDKVYRYKIEVKYLDGSSQWTDVIEVETPRE